MALPYLSWQTTSVALKAQACNSAQSLWQLVSVQHVSLHPQVYVMGSQV